MGILNAKCFKMIPSKLSFLRCATYKNFIEYSTVLFQVITNFKLQKGYFKNHLRGTGGRKRPLIDTKAFTVINQIYLQFIQMFDLQPKKNNNTKTHIPRGKNQETSLSKIPLFYTRQNAVEIASAET